MCLCMYVFVCTNVGVYDHGRFVQVRGQTAIGISPYLQPCLR